MVGRFFERYARSPQHVEDHLKVIEAQVEAAAEIEFILDAVVSESRAVIEENKSRINAEKTQKGLGKSKKAFVRPGSRDLEANGGVFRLDAVDTHIGPVEFTKSEQYAIDSQFGPVKPTTCAYQSEDEEGDYRRIADGFEDNVHLISGFELAKRLCSLKRSTSGETDKLSSVKSLTHGGEAKVWLLRREKNKELVVCKAIPHGLNSISPPTEVRILQSLLPRHDRIVRLRDWFSGSMSTQLYFDYFGGGDLEQLSFQYYRHGARFPESFLWHIYLQLCEAVAFIHHGYDHRRRDKQPEKWQKIIHRDLKPANIFLRLPLNYPGKGLYPSIVLGDFGMASLHNTSDRIIGTPEFQPPEIPMASRKADVWAIGAIMHALIHYGQAPIAPKPKFYPGSKIDWFCEPIARAPNPIDDTYSRGLAVCVFGALRHDPKKRWGIVDLLNTILNSQQRKRCMREEWKPLADWAFSEDPRIKTKVNERRVSSRASDCRMLLD